MKHTVTHRAVEAFQFTKDDTTQDVLDFVRGRRGLENLSFIEAEHDNGQKYIKFHYNDGLTVDGVHTWHMLDDDDWIVCLPGEGGSVECDEYFNSGYIVMK